MVQGQGLVGIGRREKLFLLGEVSADSWPVNWGFKKVQRERHSRQQ